MKATTIIYWTSTTLFCMPMLAGGIADLVQPQPIRDGFEHLGYPLVLASILGVWKVLGVIALAAPGLPRVKEWAYAGFMLNLTSASVSHVASGDAVSDVVTPLMLFAVVMISWALRPANRRLGVILPDTAPLRSPGLLANPLS